MSLLRRLSSWVDGVAEQVTNSTAVVHQTVSGFSPTTSPALFFAKSAAEQPAAEPSIQHIGMTRDRGTEFTELRTHHRKAREARALKLLSQLDELRVHNTTELASSSSSGLVSVGDADRSAAWRAVNSGGGVVSGFRRLSAKWTRTAVSGNAGTAASQGQNKSAAALSMLCCPGCSASFGLLCRRHPCSLCDVHFCSSCVRTPEAGTKLPPDVEVCIRCFFAITLIESRIQFRDALAASLDAHPILPRALELQDDRAALVDELQHHEYISESIDEREHIERTEGFAQIFQRALAHQGRCAARFRLFESSLREFMRLQSPDPRVLRIQKLVVATMTQFIQDNLPPFRRRCARLTVVQTNAIRNLYAVVSRLAMESMVNGAFWERYGPMYGQVLNVLRKDLMDCAFASGEDWKELEKHVREIVDRWEEENQQSLLPLGSGMASDNPHGEKKSGAATLGMHEATGSILRANVQCLRAARRKFDSKMGTDNEPAGAGGNTSLQLPGVVVLGELIEHLNSAYETEAFGHLRRTITPCSSSAGAPSSRPASAVLATNRNQELQSTYIRVANESTNRRTSGAARSMPVVNEAASLTNGRLARAPLSREVNNDKPQHPAEDDDWELVG